MRLRSSSAYRERAGGATGLLAVACAVTVANIYFPQPLLTAIAHSMRVPPQTAGLIVSLGQAGYASGCWSSFRSATRPTCGASRACCLC